MGVQIGKVWVRVVPNTRNFRADLKKTLEKVEKNSKVKVTATLNTKKFLTNVREAIKAGQAIAQISAKVEVQAGQLRQDVRKAAERAEASVDVQMDPVDRAFKQRLREKVLNAAEAVEASIPATVNGEELRRELQRKVTAAQVGLDAEIPVDVEKAAEFRANLEKITHEIEAMKPAVHAHAETAKASRELAFLSRTRVAHIIANVDTASLGKAHTLMMGLSGGRVVSNLASHFMDMAKNLDTLTPKLSLTALKIASISAASVSTVGNVLTLSSSFLQLGKAGLALPGMFSAFAVGMLGSIDGLENFHVYAREVGYELSSKSFIRSIREPFRINFWAEATSGLRSLLRDGVMPLVEGYKGLASHLGRFWGNFFQGTADGIIAVGGMAKMFAPLYESIDIAAEGIGAFMNALIRLGTAGGQFLPPLAQAFTDMSNAFLEWAETADIEGMIQQGITAAKQFGAVVGGIFGILGGLTQAAQEAGGAGLGTLAAGLERINTAVREPAFQGALVEVFSGANQAMKNLGPGISALAGAFVSLAPTISTVFQLAGESISLLLEGLSDALKHPAFQAGLKAMFEGIRDGAEALAPHLEGLGPKFGAVASVIGELARALGPVLGAGLDAFAPVLESLAEAAEAVIPVLGDGLVKVFEAMAPVVQVIADVIEALATAFPGLSAVIVVVVGVLGGLFAVVLKVAAVLSPIFDLIGSISTALSGTAAVWGAVTSAIGSVVSILGTVISAIGSVIAAIGAAPLIIGAILIALVALTIMYWDEIVAAVQAAWEWIVEAVQNGIEWVSDLIDTVLNWISETWSNIWQSISDFVQQIWGGIKEWISGAIGFVRDIIAKILNGIREVWTTTWENIRGFATSVWTNIRTAVATAIRAVSTVIGSVLRGVSQLWTGVWGSISRFIGSVWRGITQGAGNAMRSFVKAISTGIRSAVEFFVNLPSSIWRILGSLGDSMHTIGHNIMVGLWNGLVGMTQKIYDMMRDTVKNIVKIAKNILGIHSPSKVFMEIGDYTGQGMVLGLEGQASKVQAQMEAMITPPGPQRFPAEHEVSGAAPIPAESLDGATLRLETDAGTIMARLVGRGKRVLNRA